VRVHSRALWGLDHLVHLPVGVGSHGRRHCGGGQQRGDGHYSEPLDAVRGGRLRQRVHCSVRDRGDFLPVVPQLAHPLELAVGCGHCRELRVHGVCLGGLHLRGQPHWPARRLARPLHSGLVGGLGAPVLAGVHHDRPHQSAPRVLVVLRVWDPGGRVRARGGVGAAPVSGTAGSPGSVRGAAALATQLGVAPAPAQQQERRSSLGPSPSDAAGAVAGRGRGGGCRRPVFGISNGLLGPSVVARAGPVCEAHPHRKPFGRQRGRAPVHQAANVLGLLSRHLLRRSSGPSPERLSGVLGQTGSFLHVDLRLGNDQEMMWL